MIVHSAACLAKLCAYMILVGPGLLCAAEAKKPLVDGRAAFEQLSGELIKGLPVDGKIKIGVLGTASAGGGKSPEKMEAALKMTRAEVERALSRSPQVELIARDQLADIETEGGFQNKKVEIKGVDALVRGTLFYKGRTVSLHVELVFLDGRNRRHQPNWTRNTSDSRGLHLRKQNYHPPSLASGSPIRLCSTSGSLRSSCAELRLGLMSLKKLTATLRARMRLHFKPR